MIEAQQEERGGTIGKRRQAALWLSIFALLVILASAGWLAWEARRQVQHAADRLAEDTAFFLADHGARLFEASSLVLNETLVAIGDRPWAEIAGDRALWQRLDDLSSRFPYVDDIWLNDSSGDLRLSTVGWPSPASNTRDRDFFRAHLEPGGSVFVSQRITGRVTNKETFLLSRRLEDAKGDFRGIASLTLDLDYFKSFYRSLNLRFAPDISLLRDDDDQPLVRTATLDGEVRVATAATRRIPDTPVYVSVSVPASAVTAAWVEDLRLYAMVAALATLALALLSVQALREAAADRRTQEELERRVRERTEALVGANRQLEVLFQEVHHRVKNNLQVITSLLRLQASRVADQGVRQALRESVDRVQAMALVHKLLYSSNELSDLDFSGYLRTLAAHLEEAYGTAGRVVVAVEAEEARLGLDVAIPLGLMVNEALSNALKHGYPDDRAGTVRIALHRAEDGWFLSVADDGVGLPEGFDWTKGKGLGLRIIRSLASQLHGRADLRDAGPLHAVREGGKGTLFTLLFPGTVSGT